MFDKFPAYNHKNNSIHPSEYEEHLAGAICRVSFSLIHYLIKQRHIYNAAIRDITVLRPPSTVAPTSLKDILHPKKKEELLNNSLYIRFFLLLPFSDSTFSQINKFKKTRSFFHSPTPYL
jgi:hypothetical protein